MIDKEDLLNNKDFYKSFKNGEYYNTINPRFLYICMICVFICYVWLLPWP